MSAMVVMSADELRQLIRDEVGAAVGKTSRDEFMSSEQVARELLGVEPKTISTLVRRDGLPAFRVGMKLYRFERTAVIEWMKARQFKAGGHSRKHAAQLKSVTNGG